MSERLDTKEVAEGNDRMADTSMVAARVVKAVGSMIGSNLGILEMVWPC